ncbi:uncharacterized protein A4U43_C09F2690 [Asparagus officinalis]|uniref:MORF/ORRM1/DAG-like MORF domain-containing protein n=2 Tax=Asparagus officinalis TaxID=4686 RepID=A0A5P1E4S2_ASPOF|nr:uncharacterized protein A4U43_C09F2690 [Asparagus officinalis]
MALSLRVRRALTLSSSILDRHFSSISSSPRLFSPKPYPSTPGNPSPHPTPRPHSLIRPQSFRSSPALMDRRFDSKEPEIGPDDILFEGCDYNHWLITMDFPKDPENAPTAEEMVATYVKTAAMVFGSEEEAKKRIYACSTTTYQGFQCVMDEETSEKFRGLPGVVFILPDSYIDPVNKEYGGDKYENGVITHRPPPIQYRRQDGRQGRYGDRNRNYEQQSQGRYGDRQGNVPQDGRGQRFSPPPQDGRGFGPPPQDGRGFGPPPQDGRGFGPPPQDGRGFGPPPQDGRG